MQWAQGAAGGAARAAGNAAAGIPDAVRKGINKFIPSTDDDDAEGDE